MDVKYRYSIQKEIKFCLIFFCLAFIGACGRGDEVKIEHIDYENGRAVGVTFSTAMDLEKLRVFVGEESQTSVIGVIVSDANKHSFTPVIPFTEGQKYSLRMSDTLVMASFVIPKREGTEAALLAIYPKIDTVPENLLKMYFEFAQPMQEVGNALDFISVRNETDGHIVAPFLKLETELWNKDHTLLTLWLDPGRIKTDLIPNRERGLPLIAGKRYTVSVDSSWKSTRGVPLKNSHAKKIYVRSRDDRKPELGKWQLGLVQTDSTRQLDLDFGEPMDAFLSVETIRFFDRNGKQIKGHSRLLANQSQLRFEPDGVWSGQEIEIRVQSRLEDLAGNNLERRFDTPISGGKSRELDTAKMRSRTFKLTE